MNDINKVFFTGRLTKDATIYDKSEQKIYKLSAAINGSKKQGDEWVQDTTFVDFTYFSKLDLADVFRKGTQVNVLGGLRKDKWTDEKGNHEQLSIVASQIIPFATTNKSETQTTPARPYPPREDFGSPSQFRGPETFEDSDSDIPF